MAEPFTFTRETRILEALELDPKKVGEALQRLGLKCVDAKGYWCAAVEVENLADAARFHDVPLETILAELNRLGIVRAK